MSGFLLPRPCLRRTGTTLAALLCLALAACGIGGPPPVTYVLGTPIVAAERVQPLAGRPVIEVKPVLVPDYLDVSDIMVRQAGNMVTPSPTGRWGERLSVGVTRALADGLAARLPGFVVTTTAPEAQPARQVLVEAETFEPRTDGTVVLVARWRVLDGEGRSTLAGQRVSLVEPLADSGDAAVASAMTRVIEGLADSVAAGLTRAKRSSGAPPAGT